MSQCRKCGVKVSFFGGRNDGLCESCGKLADEQAKLDAKKAEEEQAAKANVQAEQDRAAILQRMTLEQPVAHLFFYRDLEAKKESLLTKVPGMAAGVLIGGVAGQIVFGGTMLKERAVTHVAKVGVLVLTRTQALIVWVESPMFNDRGWISEEHLSMIRQKLESNGMHREVFQLATTRIQPSSDNSHLVLTSGSQNFYLRSASVRIHGKHWDQPSQTRIMDLARQQGGMLSESDIFYMIQNNQGTVTQDDLLRLKSDPKLLYGLFMMILQAKNRELLGANISRLQWAMDLLGDQFRKCAGGLSVQRIKITVGWLIALGCLVLGLLAEDNKPVWFVISGIALIFALVCIALLNNAKWARHQLRTWLPKMRAE